MMVLSEGLLQRSNELVYIRELCLVNDKHLIKQTAVSIVFVLNHSNRYAMYITVILICTSLMTTDVEQIFNYVLETCISSW